MPHFSPTFVRCFKSPTPVVAMLCGRTPETQWDKTRQKSADFCPRLFQKTTIISARSATPPGQKSGLLSVKKNSAQKSVGFSREKQGKSAPAEKHERTKVDQFCTR